MLRPLASSARRAFGQTVVVRVIFSPSPSGEGLGWGSSAELTSLRGTAPPQPSAGSVMPPA